MTIKENKFILDACCGGRMFWFDKNQANTVYIDNRLEKKGHSPLEVGHSIQPDIVMDFRKMAFPDKRFKLVVFDPPHIRRKTYSGNMPRTYGILNPETWETDLQEGFSECWRVLEDYGTLIFKWNDVEVSTKEILGLFPIKPLFGTRSVSKYKGRTHWYCFMKLPKDL